MAASAGLTIAKAVVGVLSGSLAILSEAAHSLIDLLATVMTYFAVRVSGKPADAEHHYGHGKVESIAALAETGLLFLLCAVVLWEAAKRLLGAEHHAIEANLLAFAVVIGSIVIDFFRARALNAVAAETASEALAADALHFSSDMWSSVAVLIGLVAVSFGYPWADALAALIVAGFVCLAAVRLVARTVSTLTDQAPPGLAQRLSDVAQGVKGVVAVERVRVRAVGPVVFAELSLGVSRTLPIDRADGIKDAVTRAVRAEVPEAEVSVTTLPRALDDETVLERVLVIARNRALAVHHVTVQAIGERLAVSLDLEVAGNSTLEEAHEVATGLEQAIKDELGPEVEVESHIEPLQIADLLGREDSPQHCAEVRAVLAELMPEGGALREVHAVRVRRTPEGEIVNFHCYADPQLRVEDVHEGVDEVERALRRRFPAIKRVIGHAEPRRAAAAATDAAPAPQPAFRTG